MKTEEVVLAGAVRTPIGKFGGSLADQPAPELGAFVLKEALKRAGISPEDVDEVIMGCVLSGGLGQNPARQASIYAGIPNQVPAFTVSNVCGSGLKSINLAAAQIEAGEAQVILARGMENMSAAPYLLPDARFGYRMNHGKLVDSMIQDALWDAFNDYHMGMTAENLAVQYGITRQMQDEFAAFSQQKCEAAQAAGRFAEEIAPYEIVGKKKNLVFAEDEFPRQGVTAKGLSVLKPAFKKEGTVTAANSSGINDGAAAMVVMSKAAARRLGVKPMARWTGGAWAGVDPSVMGIGPVASTRKLFQKTGLAIGDIDLIEANEAFAAQALAVGKELNWNPDLVNVNGGAIALGHPVGASGCRILVTLLHEMKKRKAKRGLATLCVGGGMGVSSIVENLEVE